MFQAVDVIKQYICFKQSVSSGLCYQAVCIKQSMFQVVYVIKQSVSSRLSVSSRQCYQAVQSICIKQSVYVIKQSVCIKQSGYVMKQSVYVSSSQSMFQTVCVLSSLCIKRSVYVSSSQSTYQAVSLRIKQSVYIINQSAYVWNSQSTLLLPIRHSRFEMQCLAFQGQVWQVQSFSLKLTEVFYKYLTNFKTDESGH